MFNVESPQELESIDECAGRLGQRARISHPDQSRRGPEDASLHLDRAQEKQVRVRCREPLKEYRKARELRNIDVIGVDCHIGSQLTEVAPFVERMNKLKELIGVLRSEGFEIRYLDLGGGLGIRYNEEMPPHPREYARGIIDNAKGLDCTLVFEPGPRHRRECRDPGDERAVYEIKRREELHHRRCGDERPDPPELLRLLSSDPARDREQGADDLRRTWSGPSANPGISWPRTGSSRVWRGENRSR